MKDLDCAICMLAAFRTGDRSGISRAATIVLGTACCAYQDHVNEAVRLGQRTVY